MKYQPISCDYYDELTLLSMRRTSCPIVYRKEDGTEVIIETVIQDIFTRSGEEFLLLPDGLEIRLDRLVSVAGKVLSSYC